MSSANSGSGRFSRLAMPAVVAAALGAAALPAAAQPYLGWDFGNGFGIGIGTPPSAYTPCPDYGWGPFYPYRCYYRPHRVRHAHVRRTPHTAWVPPASAAPAAKP